MNDLHSYVKPYWEHLLNGRWAEGVTNGTLTVPEMQGWMIQLYPFIHTFPKFLAEALIKCEDDYSRGFYIMNIRVEKAHAEQWLWMGEGFGARREDMLALASSERQLLRDVQSLNDWLWMLVVVVSMLAHRAVGLGAQINNGLITVVLKSRGHFARRCHLPSPRWRNWLRRLLRESAIQFGHTDILFPLHKRFAKGGAC